MTRKQFTIRQMFVALTLICVALSALTWLARHRPEVFVFAFVGSLTIGVLGAGVLVLAGLMALSVCAAPETDEQKLNVAKCNNLALIGALMVAIPILIAIAGFVLVPLVHPPKAESIEVTGDQNIDIKNTDRENAGRLERRGSYFSTTNAHE